MRPVTMITCVPVSRTPAMARDRAGPQHCVLRDQRAVEIEGEGRDPARERGRKLEQCYGVPPVALTT